MRDGRNVFDLHRSIICLILCLSDVLWSFIQYPARAMYWRHSDPMGPSAILFPSSCGVRSGYRLGWGFGYAHGESIVGPMCQMYV